jgi:S1-C subfamily serine protease
MMGKFSDVPEDAWYAGLAEKYDRMGLLRGEKQSDGTYKARPLDGSKRIESATMAYRASKISRYALKQVRKSVVFVQNMAGGEGTGVIVDPRGIVWTNRHVVCNPAKRSDGSVMHQYGVSDKYRIATGEREYYDDPNDQFLVNKRQTDVEGQPFVPGAFATLLRFGGKYAASIPTENGGTGIGPLSYLPDFALIQMSPEQIAEAKQRLGNPLPCATFVMGLPDIGEPLFQFGSPMGFRGWFSQVNAAYRYKQAGLLPTLGLDGATNPGNSGGPVWTLEGLCVGITTWKLVATSGTPVDSMGLAQISWEEGVKWLAYHGIFVSLAPDIPDEDELVA